MKSTGIVRRIDDLGRVAIPKEIRRAMHLQDGDPVEFFVADDKTLSLRRYQPLGEVLKDEASFLIPAFRAEFDADIVVVDDIGCVINSTKNDLAGKRLNLPIPEDVSTATKISFGEDTVAVSGFCRIVTYKRSFSERCEGAVLVIGGGENAQFVARVLARAIGQKIEEYS